MILKLETILLWLKALPPGPTGVTAPLLSLLQTQHALLERGRSLNPLALPGGSLACYKQGGSSHL